MRPQNWVASDHLNISNGQQDIHVGFIVLAVRSTFMLTKNIITKLNRLFSVKEFLHPTQRFIHIFGDFTKIW